MGLVSGTQLSRYEIASPLGQGGMGEDVASGLLPRPTRSGGCVP